MARATQEALVQRQFGAQAEHYLASPVHAHGEDLEALAACVRAQPEAHVLDLGCGAGHVAFAAAEAGGRVTAYDLSAEMLAVVAAEAGRRGLSVVTVQGPAEVLPFESGSFDLVLSRYSAHHWRDFAAGVREAARVLRAGGTAAFVDVVSPGIAVLDTYLQAAEVMRDISHVRDRSVAEWQVAAAEAGLLVSSVAPGRLRLEFEVVDPTHRHPAGAGHVHPGAAGRHERTRPASFCDRAGREFHGGHGADGVYPLLTGGKTRLGGISRAGDERLRQLLVLGATVVIRHAKPGRVSAWLLALLARRPRKLVAVALANKMARIVWAMMTSGEAYRQPNAVAA